ERPRTGPSEGRRPAQLPRTSAQPARMDARAGPSADRRRTAQGPLAAALPGVPVIRRSEKSSLAAMDQIPDDAGSVAGRRARGARAARSSQREPGDDSIQSRPAPGDGRADPGAVRPGRDAADRGWPRAGPLAPPGPEHASAAGDR